MRANDVRDKEERATAGDMNVLATTNYVRDKEERATAGEVDARANANDVRDQEERATAGDVNVLATTHDVRDKEERATAGDVDAQATAHDPLSALDLYISAMADRVKKCRECHLRRLCPLLMIGATLVPEKGQRKRREHNISIERSITVLSGTGSYVGLRCQVQPCIVSCHPNMEELNGAHTKAYL